MSGQRRRYDRWRDVDGTHVPVGARVQQVEVHAGLGALRFRLNRCGEVIGRGATRLVVRFDGEEQVVSIRPHLVRVFPPLIAEQIMDQLEQLRDLAGDGDGR